MPVGHDVHRRLHRGVQVAQQRRIVARRRADQREGRRMKITHRRAFAQEFRVAEIREPVAQPAPGGGLQRRDHPLLGSTGRQGGAHDNDVRPGLFRDRRTDLRDHRIHRAQRNAAIRGARRPDGDQRQVGGGNRFGRLASRPQPALRHRAADQLADLRLDNGRQAAIQHGHLLGRNIDAHDVMAQRGQAAAGDRPDIANSEHRYAHRAVTPFHLRWYVPVR